jgi:hypothetical protein
MNSITSYHCCAALVVGLLFGVAQAPAQYTPAPRDYAAYRLLLDDGTGNGFYGILRLSGSLSNHRYYNLPANASGDFIFHTNNSGGTRNMTISASNVAVFGNADLWLANNDGAASELRFFEAYNAAGAFPNTANYTAFKAQDQTGNITYTLPAAAPTSDGQILTSTALGTMSWGRKITKVTVTQNIASVAANSRITETFTVTGAGVGGSVVVSPSGDLTAGLVISYARVSASNTVTVAFQNVTGAAIDEGSLDWDITIIE